MNRSLSLYPSVFLRTRTDISSDSWCPLSVVFCLLLWIKTHGNSFFHGFIIHVPNRVKRFLCRDSKTSSSQVAISGVLCNLLFYSMVAVCWFMAMVLSREEWIVDVKRYFTRNNVISCQETFYLEFCSM